MGTNKFNDINQISYEQAIREIQTGDIILCSGQYLVSELIKKASNSIFSHVGILFRWNEHIMILESVEDDGVRAIPLWHYVKNYENSNRKYNGYIYVARHEMIKNSNLSSGKIRIFFEEAINSLNRNYDKNEIARIVARIGLGIGRHEDNDEYICSEFVDECFKKLEVEFSRDSMGYILPEHIAADPNIKPLFQISI